MIAAVASQSGKGCGAFASELWIKGSARDAHTKRFVDTRQRFPAIAAGHDIFEMTTQTNRLVVVDHDERLALGQPVETAEDDGATVDTRQAAYVELEVLGRYVGHAFLRYVSAEIIGVPIFPDFAPAQTGENFSPIPYPQETLPKVG